VDIGDLEVVILDGYPGSRMAFRQMAGRAGRVAPGLVLYMPALDERGLPHPVDAFYSNTQNFATS
jgi:DEAD/DEAH box helicase domain-containing protein